MLNVRNMSIRHKLLLIIMVSGSVSLLLAGVVFVTYDWISTKESLVSRLHTMAQVVGSNSTAAIVFDAVGDAEETLAALKAAPEVVAACVYSRDGQAFARYTRTSSDFHPPSPEDGGHRFEGDHLLLFEPVILDGERIGTVCLKSDLRELHTRRWRYISIAVAFLLASSLATLALGAKLRTIISEPILDLVRTMGRVSEEKRYSIRATRHSEDELGRLIDGFNAMLAQIEDRDEALTQARNELAQQAHELQVELAQRRRAEERITQSLREKEVLLQEIHHRVKNNLQVISSLLELQSVHVPDEAAREMLRDSQNRIRSMSMAHERLYATEDLARIDLREYIEDLCGRLVHSHVADRGTVTLHTEVADLSLDVATAIPCGLIVNELVTNALRHAFPDKQSGSIRVSLLLTDDAQCRLAVADDGVGVVASVDPHNPTSLGLGLVNTLARQLHGELEMKSDGGTRVSVVFPRDR